MKRSLESLGITIGAAADQLGVSRKHLSDVLNGKAGISPAMAIRLEKGLGSTASQWLRMQVAYDLAQETPTRIRVRKLTAMRQKAARA